MRILHSDYRCPECVRKRAREYYHRNAEARREYARRYDAKKRREKK